MNDRTKGLLRDLLPPALVRGARKATQATCSRRPELPAAAAHDVRPLDDVPAQVGEVLDERFRSEAGYGHGQKRAQTPEVTTTQRSSRKWRRPRCG